MMKEQLAELKVGPESDEYGRLRPTQHAFDKALVLLGGVSRVPHGCVSTDSEGGVRIEWVRETSSVHLVVPAASSNEPYIYHEVDGSYATEDATLEGLSYWLIVQTAQPTAVLSSAPGKGRRLRG